MSETIVAYQSFIGVDLHKTTVTLVAVAPNGDTRSSDSDCVPTAKEKRPLQASRRSSPPMLGCVTAREKRPA